MAKATFKWNEANVANLRQGVMRGLLKMGADIASRARANAPYKTGALRTTIRVTEGPGTSVLVIAGGNFAGKSVAYARIQELGGWAGRNHSVYIKPKRYMMRAVEGVARGNINQYFKGVL